MMNNDRQADNSENAASTVSSCQRGHLDGGAVQLDDDDNEDDHWGITMSQWSLPSICYAQYCNG